MIYENQVIFHKKCVRGLNYNVHGYRLAKRYYITPEFTVLHGLNVYSWRFVVSLLGNFNC